MLPIFLAFIFLNLLTVVRAPPVAEAAFWVGLIGIIVCATLIVLVTARIFDNVTRPRVYLVKRDLLQGIEAAPAHPLIGPSISTDVTHGF